MATIQALVEVDDAVKLRFAASYARSKNASTAALSVFSNPGQALKQAQTLPFDPVVIREIARIEDEEGEVSLMPTKNDLVRKILDRAERTMNDEHYEKLMRLAANMMGHIEKPGTNLDLNLKVSNVMVVRTAGSDDEWQAKIAAQQRELTINAAN